MTRETQPATPPHVQLAVQLTVSRAPYATAQLSELGYQARSWPCCEKRRERRPLECPQNKRTNRGEANLWKMMRSKSASPNTKGQRGVSFFESHICTTARSRVSRPSTPQLLAHRKSAPVGHSKTVAPRTSLPTRSAHRPIVVRLPKRPLA